MMPFINALQSKRDVDQQNTGGSLDVAAKTIITYQTDRQLYDSIIHSNWDVVEDMLCAKHISPQEKNRWIEYQDKLWERNALLNAIVNHAPLSIIKLITES